MKVYLVGDHGCEHNSIKSVHKTYEGALKVFHELRLELKENMKMMTNQYDGKEPLKDWQKEDLESWQKVVDAYDEEDPEKIDVSPHETPYIRPMEVQE